MIFIHIKIYYSLILCPMFQAPIYTTDSNLKYDRFFGSFTQLIRTSYQQSKIKATKIVWALMKQRPFTFFHTLTHKLHFSIRN